MRIVESPRRFFIELDPSDRTHYPAHIDFQIVVIELEKFEKPLHDLDSFLDQWLYFLRDAETLKEVPQTMADQKEINQAFVAAELAHLVPSERDELEKREKYALSAEFDLALAREIAYEEGLAVGRRQAAINLLKSGLLSADEIAVVSGLTLAEVKQLQSEIPLD